MTMSKNTILTLMAAVLAFAGCSKEEPGAPAEKPGGEIPESFTEARQKGMVDAKWNAELEKARKSAANPVNKLSAELEKKELELAKAKESGASKDVIEGLEKDIALYKEGIIKAEKIYRRQMINKIRARMHEEAAAVKQSRK